MYLTGANCSIPVCVVKAYQLSLVYTNVAPSASCSACMRCSGDLITPAADQDTNLFVLCIERDEAVEDGSGEVRRLT